LKTTNTEVPGSIPGHSLGFFWGTWVWNGVHSASWSDKLSSCLNKEVTVMQLWDSMCWPYVNTVPFWSRAVGKDCQRRLLSRPRFVRAVAPRKKNVEYQSNYVILYCLIMNTSGKGHWNSKGNKWFFLIFTRCPFYSCPLTLSYLYSKNHTKTIHTNAVLLSVKGRWYIVTIGL
jgi:hypothetical protein